MRVHECFEVLADRQPAAPAIVIDGGTLSYAELDQRANSLARALLAHGLKTEEAVGVLTERSGLLPLAFLAILKAGGAYVPMGADLPPRRLASMATQSGMRLLIALDGLKPPAELGLAVLRPEELSSEGQRPNQQGKATDLAAILFTSGSTGQPKGVLLQHDACINMGHGHIAAQGIVPEDRVLLASAPGFILGFREVCLPLLAGAAFVPAPRALLDDPAGLLAFMSRHRVTVAMFTPSYLRLFQGAAPAGLRCLITAGERPIADDARAYARKLDYWNIHGATEVCGAICMSKADPDGDGPLPSGRPFANTTVHLLGANGVEVPPGEAGEIHVVGLGVARGYLNRPDLTAERFVETPYGRAFRSNDLGRWNKDGQLETLGRAGDVVKVSGQSVSLGEIEQTLLRHGTVRRAAAMQHEGKLIAFVESDRTEPASLEDWHRFLSRTLPAYMLPAAVTTLPSLPINSYGKVDRQSLLNLAQAVRADRGELPRGGVEQQIAAVWEELLGVHAVMREDNYFALGGTSLLAIEIGQRLQALGYPVSAQTILASTTVAALAGKIAQASPDSPAAAVDQDAATAGQEDFWIAWKLGLATTGSQITRVLAVRGIAPEPARWQSAWTSLVARHPALRTAFFADAGDKVHWRTAEELTVPFSLDQCASPKDAWERIAARAHAPFVLTEAPLARAGLVQLEEGETLFWFAVHHAVADGLSARVIQEEMHALLLEPPEAVQTNSWRGLSAGRAGIRAGMSSAPNGIAEASRAERQYLASELGERDRTYWRDKLDSLPEEAFHEFATDHRRPASPSGKAAVPIVERLDATAVAALTRLAQTQQVGLHALLLTLLAAEARRRDGRSNLMIGSGISVRPPGAERAVGHFVNALPVILPRAEGLSLAAQMRATQAALTECMEHSAYPSGLLYREFRQRCPQARPEARTSLFDIALTANPSRNSGAAAGFLLTPAHLPGEAADPGGGLDLAFSHEPVDDPGGSLELALHWDRDVYSRTTAQAWLHSLASWARWVAEDTERASAPLPALLPEEAHSLAHWERGPVRPRPARRFHELFETQADCDPYRAAVVTDAGVQSYAELDQRANRVAQVLLDHHVAHEEPVAVLTESSADLPAAVLGIWKAGAAYLPLALDQPPERLAHMAADSGARVLIVLDGHAVPPPLAKTVQVILTGEAWDGNASLRWAERPEVAGSPRDLAYIIYTSGTSGMPKGVLVQHDSLINVGYASREAFGLTPGDRFSLAATPGFDASLWELGAALLNGLAVVPVSRALRDDPWALKQWYKTYGVTAAFHAPSYLRVSKQAPFEGMRVLITGGEAPNHDDARHHAGYLAYWNAYGPTETCIYLCAGQISTHPDPSRPLPVGRPMPNTCISIRRENGDPAPPGAMGEVWLGGMGLARGYLNNPDLTSTRFVQTPEGRFYRSGDLGRWTEDGRLELGGRIDQQVKLHGQRLELGEIEQALLAHPGVAQAVALMEGSASTNKVLQAFVRLSPGASVPVEGEWRSYLKDRLPPYMIPASVTPVAAIPVTQTGKIDRDALLLAPRMRVEGAAKTPPRGEMETRIASLWTDLLGCEVSREDNFFGLGGNSLLAITIAYRLSRELARPVPARELFAAPTLAGFAQRIAELLDAGSPARPAARSDLATEGQREFWVAEAAGLDTRSFNIPLLRLIEGEMPPLDRWNTAWAKLVARHEALRTSFQEDAEGRLRRVVVPALAAAMETATLPNRAAAQVFVRQRQTQPFAMETAPLWRAGLIELETAGEHLFWLALHHSVGDGRTLGILLEELSALLRGEALPPLACDFGESAAREQAHLAGPACARDARYWREVLAQQPDSAFEEGPLDFARSITAKTGMHRFEVRFDANTATALRDLARRHEASLHALLVTVLALEVRRRRGRAHVILGTTASVRETAAEEQVAGYYVNMLPLAHHLPPQVTFGGALRDTQRALAAALQHARYPFARMYRDFWSGRPQHRHPARYPLFDFAVTENPEAPPPPPGVRFERLFVPADGSATGFAYELTDASPGQDMVVVHERLADGTLMLQWQVNAALYTRETAQSWFEALRGWAAWLAGDGHRADEPVPGLLPAEAVQLESWERGPEVARPALRFHELFERVADNQGHRPAVVTETAVLTYSALEREANAIAHSLLLRGAAPGAVVGVLTGRSAGLPAAVLGIWKAGAIYLPLDADLPEERLEFMACDAGLSLLIALDGLPAPSALPAPLRPEELNGDFRSAHAHRPEAAGSPAGDAYIIYTSGSTGRPKGAAISHAAYVNTVLGAGEIMGLTHNDRSLMFASPSFDVSLSDIGLPLAFGAAVCPVPFEVLSSPNRFRAFLSELGVTVADITPTYLRLFDGSALPSLRILVTGGEAPFPVDVDNYAGRLQYFNAYGPTENTITSTMGRLRAGEIGTQPAGRPLPNTTVHICGPDGNPLPPGMIGELWLGGAGLARGYVGKPELTAAAFVETAGGRRYRTGDLGRWRPAGELAVLGRIDDQVKLNGIRVELGEIEHALGSHPGVAQAVALLDGDTKQSQSLWAFVRPVPGKQAPAEDSWPDYLATRLPAYMIPSAVIAIPEIPLSNSGKVDKAALKALLVGRAPHGGGELPKDGLEALVARVWSDVLGQDSICRDDNFFALGGHSLLAIAVAHRLEEALGRPVPARDLFAEPTLGGFTERLEKLGKASLSSAAPSDRATTGQREFWIAERAGLDTRGFNVGLTLVAGGKVPPAAQWRQAWAALVRRHDALRTGFREDGDGALRRFVLPECFAELEVVTQPDMPAALAHVRARQAAAFAMEVPPLWRAGLMHVADTGQPVFWLVLHHSIGDGVSLEVLTEELGALLQDRELPPFTSQLDHSAGREEQYLAGPACIEDALYWSTLLGGLGDGSQPFDEWPLDLPRPLSRTEHNASGAHTFRVRLAASTATGLRGFAQRNGASLHALLLTIMAQEVRRRTGRPEFVIGTAASIRDSASEARTVGYYVNMLPVPCRVHGNPSIEAALRAVQRSLSEGLQHARYPFARMYGDFRQNHVESPHPARYPLFDMAVTEVPGALEADSHDRDGLRFESVTPLTGDTVCYEFRTSGPGQDMVLVHEGQPDGSLVLQWCVNAAIYEKETAQAWIGALAGWARFLAEGRRRPDSSLPALLPEEESRLAAWEQGPVMQHPAPSIAARFEHWARVQPDRPALVTGQGELSYATLDARSNALADALLALGVTRQEPVGVFTGRSIALPETVLAIWKAGACYLPLVTDLPADRLAFIARDAGVRILIVLDGHEPPAALLETGCRVFRPEASLPLAPARAASRPGMDRAGSELAYIMYTSGSTGQPKGVMLHHRGLTNLGVASAALLDVRPSDRVLMMASPSFDAWIFELIVVWTVGAASVPVLRDEMDDIMGMREKLERLGVSVATMTPSYLRLFEQADFPSLRILMTVGEPPHRADALHYAARLRYFNGYGPTENTVAVSLGRVAANAQRLTVGTPLANTSVHILNEEGVPVPPGAVGEVWLAGMGLALGYLNRPDLTAASFVETPSGRRYRTGDLGRWTHTGELEVLGRVDGQVKLRGQRVELGEIEHRIAAHQSVRQAAAVVETQPGGTQILWAFVCLHPGAAEPAKAEWHENLSATLPSYMLPSAVVAVPAIPVNLAGKVDRAALLRTVSGRGAGPAGEPRTPPRDGMERTVAQVWSEHLGGRPVSREDGFFDLGGNSLRAISVVGQLRRTLHCTVNDLYEHPRLADFAATCRERPEHLRTLLQSAARHWRDYRRELAAYEAEREAALGAARLDYEARNQFHRRRGPGERRSYERVLLTGATGYLGSYLLRELLAGGHRHVSVLVRGADDRSARARLGKVLCHYFGQGEGVALRQHPHLTVLAADLRRDDLGLAPQALDHLGNSVRAVFHCAANVKHFGRYEEFHADNVAATARLLKLAAQRASDPADFHLVSTLSVCGKAPETGFRLFTEYDAVPETLDGNYYVRSKQEAERLVVAARENLANACIHRVGNVVFAAGDGPLQAGIEDNAFFRQLAAFLQLGAVPDDSHLWLCHVDSVARGLVLLAGAAGLANQTHHIENSRRDTMAAFVTAAKGVRACDFGAFLERLERAADEPAMEAALTETLENFGLYGGVSPQARARRLEIESGRTQTLLAQMGFDWPPLPAAGQARMLREAARLFSRLPAPNAAEAVSAPLELEPCTA